MLVQNYETYMQIEMISLIDPSRLDSLVNKTRLQRGYQKGRGKIWASMEVHSETPGVEILANRIASMNNSPTNAIHP